MWITKASCSQTGQYQHFYRSCDDQIFFSFFSEPSKYVHFIWVNLLIFWSSLSHFSNLLMQILYPSHSHYGLCIIKTIFYIYPTSSSILLIMFAKSIFTPIIETASWFYRWISQLHYLHFVCWNYKQPHGYLLHSINLN